MLTKLTKTILAQDPELKVRPDLTHSVSSGGTDFFTENMGESDPHGQGILFTLFLVIIH
jgi:hypothetical protein